MPELNAAMVHVEPTVPVAEPPAPVASKATKLKTKAAAKVTKPAPAKKPVAKKEKTDTIKKDRSMSDLTPAQRSAKILGSMRKLSAVNAGSAINIATIAKKTDLGEYEVYCTMWNKGPLQNSGYIKQVKVEGVRGAAFHLTAKGQKGDPE